MPAPTPGATPVAASFRAQPNGNYDVVATAPDIVDISLSMDYFSAGPVAPIPAGTTVTVHGVGTGQWRIRPGSVPPASANTQYAPVYIDTSSIAATTAAGQAWTPNLDAKMWHWMASDTYGRVLVAAENPGSVWMSHDAGLSWTRTGSPTGNWSSAAVYTNFNDAGDRSGRSHPDILAAAYGGGLYEYRGLTGSWQPVPSGIPGVDFGNQQWESVAASTGGYALAAVLNGPIYTRGFVSSSTSTPAWSATVEAASGQPLVRAWRGVSMSGSAAGRTLTGVPSNVSVAVCGEGQVWVSEGQGWVRRDVVVNGTTVADGWYRTAISSDGNVIAVAGQTNSGLYISRDRGLTWSRAVTPTGDYTSISMTPDGATIVATLKNGASGAGSVQVSRDGGNNFAAATMPGTDTNWRASTVSGDANLIGAAAGTFTSAAGQMYTSIKGDRTTWDTGALIGGQGASVELVLDSAGGGSARWSIRSSTGTLTVR